MYRFLTLFFFIGTILFSVSANELKPVKYVFLFIGDGLSIPQRSMTEEFCKRTGKSNLLINELPFHGISTTSAANSFITDSAASGTAIACGAKTNNGRLGMDAEGNHLKSVAEEARDNGRKVGIITSVTLNNATPAAFYAHNISRGNSYDIGLDLIASRFNYFGGGGIAKHDDQANKNYKGDIFKLAEEAGYVVSNTVEVFKQLKPGMDKVISIGATDSLPYEIDRNEGDLTLADFTNQAIKLLDNPKGFFIMVEGGKIDWLGHANDAASTLYEVIDFDRAVRVAYEFAQKHPEDTLIVVTGDHETGGLTLGFGGNGYQSYIEKLTAQKCSYEIMKKKFKSLENPDFEKNVKPMITELSGLIFPVGDSPERKSGGGLVVSENQEATLKEAFERQYKNGEHQKGSYLVNAVIQLLNHKASVAWTTNAHTALPVHTTAFGAQGQFFGNMTDNTDIGKRLKMVVR